MSSFSLHRYLSCNILTSPFWSNLTTPSWLSMDSRLPVESRSSPGKKNYTFIFIGFVKFCCKYRINLKTIGIFKIVLGYELVWRTRFTTFVTFRNPFLWCTLKCVGNLPFFLWCPFEKFSKIFKLNSSIVNPHWPFR